MLALAVILISSVSHEGILQPPKTPPKPDFEFGKKYTKDIGISMGDGMVWDMTVTESDEANTFPFSECGPTCKGQKHTAHKDCDNTCDDACPRVNFKHTSYRETIVIDLGAEGNNPAPGPHAEKLNRDFSQFGFPSTWNASRYLGRLSHYLDSVTGNKSPMVAKTIEANCWHTGPCSKSSRTVKAKTLIYTLEYQLYSDSDGSGPAQRQMGPKGTLRFKALVPTDEISPAGEAVSNCRCEVPVQVEPPKDHGYLPGGSSGEGEFAYIEEKGKKRAITGQDLASLVTNISCNDMNTATFTIAASPSGNAVIPAGWELQCLEGGGQNVQLQEDLELTMASHEQRLLVSINPLVSKLTAERTLRTLCLQIDAPEPKPSMKYRLVPPSRPSLARLARITRRSSFRGPPDQVRLWIATDYASHGKISKILLPAPREAVYLREMYRAASVDAINPGEDRVRAIMENRLLAAEGNDPKAVGWFVKSKLAYGDKSLMPWLEANGAEFRKLFVEGQQKDDVAIISSICTELANVGTLEAVKAGIALVESGVPDEHRKPVYESPGVFEIANVLTFTRDETVASRILDWLETTKPYFCVAAGRNVNPELPTGIRQRAAALAAGKT